MSTTPDPIPGDIPAADIPAGDIPATSIPAGDLPTTDIPVSEVPLTEPDGTTSGDVKAEREQPDLRPLYAVAGLTELLVEAVRHTLVDTQHWASARMAELRFRQAELEKQAAQLRERADDLPDHVRTLPDTARTRAGDLQQQASHVYADLAGRGQRAVYSVAGRVDPVFDRLQESMEKARRAVTGRTGAGATPTQGPADIIVPTETLTGDDDLTSTPAGMPDESLVAEEVYLGEGAAPQSMVDEDLATGGRTDDEGEATSQR